MVEIVNSTLPEGQGGLVRTENYYLEFIMAPAVLETVHSEGEFPIRADVEYVSPG